MYEFDVIICFEDFQTLVDTISAKSSFIHKPSFRGDSPWFVAITSLF